MTIAQLCDHFEQRELSKENTWRSHATKKIYKAYLTRWVRPHWHKYELSEVRTIRVESWLRGLPLAKSSCAKIRNLMSVLFNHACRYELFDRNPIYLIRQSAKRRGAPTVLMPAEIKALVDNLGIRERTLVLLAVSTGLRQSELFGLKWADIEFTQGTCPSPRCAGVRCADGDTFRAAKAVVSTIHIKHLVDMAPSALWGEEFLQGVELFQPEHAMISLHYATTAAPEYPLPTGATISTGEAVICPRLEKYLMLNYENSTGELDLDDPPGLQIVSPSVVDPTRAPAGCHTVKIETNLPYNLKQGPEHWDGIKDQVPDSLLNHFRRFAPNLTPDKIIGKFIQSPLDIERMNPGMWRGSAHAGASNSAQNGPMRPVAGWGEYRMPIPGLFQTGACTAPGGSVTGVPGRNAAAVILKEFGTSLEEVVKKV